MKKSQMQARSRSKCKGHHACISVEPGSFILKASCFVGRFVGFVWGFTHLLSLKQIIKSYKHSRCTNFKQTLKYYRRLGWFAFFAPYLSLFLFHCVRLSESSSPFFFYDLCALDFLPVFRSLSFDLFARHITHTRSTNLRRLI